MKLELIVDSVNYSNFSFFNGTQLVLKPIDDRFVIKCKNIIVVIGTLALSIRSLFL